MKTNSKEMIWKKPLLLAVTIPALIFFAFCSLIKYLQPSPAVHSSSDFSSGITAFLVLIALAVVLFLGLRQRQANNSTRAAP